MDKGWQPTRNSCQSLGRGRWLVFRQKGDDFKLSPTM